MADCSIYADFPYGLQQTLTLGSLSLVLSRAQLNFVEDGSPRFGYRRYPAPDQQISVSYSHYGAAVKEGPAHAIKQMFEWSLNLSVTQLYTLEALADEQQLSGAAIRLKDERLAIRQKTPRSRGKVGNLITTPTPPTGHTFFWGQFDILLQLDADFFEFAYKKRTENRYSVNLKAFEMDLVGVEADV